MMPSPVQNYVGRSSSPEESDAGEDDESSAARAMMSVTSPRQPTPLPDENPAWVAFNVELLQTLPRGVSLTETFDLYVDSVRFVPDNASIVKVKGRFYDIDLGNDVETKLVAAEIECYPQLDFGYLTPHFGYRITVNKENMVANPDAVLLIEIYTMEHSTGSIVILGTVLFNVFDIELKKPVLKYGGHQLRVYYGSGFSTDEPNIPSIATLHANPFIPGVSILIRILPNSEAFVEAPDYESGYYQSEPSRPNVSEWRLFRHYLLSPDRFLTVRHVTLKLLREARHTGRVSDEDLLEWIKWRLDPKTTDEGLKSLDLVHFVIYEIDSGVAIQIKKVNNLPDHLDNRYVQCLVRILPGRASRWRLPTQEGWGGEEKFLTHNLSFRSYMRSPVWRDTAQVLHPYYDDTSVLLVELYGVQITYIRDATGRGYGTVLPVEGTELSVNTNRPIGWTVIQLFDRGSVNAGHHVYPLWKGNLSKRLIEMLRIESVENVLTSAAKANVIQFQEGATLELILWDGNFIDGQQPPFAKYMQMLEIGGFRDTFTLEHPLPLNSRRLSWIIVNAFAQSGKELDIKSEIFKYERDIFAELMLRTFTRLMNTALLRDNLKPLPE